MKIWWEYENYPTAALIIDHDVYGDVQRVDGRWICQTNHRPGEGFSGSFDSESHAKQALLSALADYHGAMVRALVAMREAECT